MIYRMVLFTVTLNDP